MKKDQFFVVLPSNSSMHVYPENTTTHFATYLPRQIELDGEWEVALTEIQIPMTMYHLKKNKNLIDQRIFVKILRNDKQKEVLLNNVIPREVTKTSTQKEPPVSTTSVSYVCSGIYSSVESFLEELNQLSAVQNHFKFLRNRGGFVFVKLICKNSCKNTAMHCLDISEKIRNILGFNQQQQQDIFELRGPEKEQIVAKKLPDITANIPNTIMIYTDILEPCITGDVHTPLLRSVALDLEKYTFGSIRVKNFSPPTYVPLLSNSFKSIEIDLRDEYGSPVPFDSGTLIATLHFKRTR